MIVFSVGFICVWALIEAGHIVVNIILLSGYMRTLDDYLVDRPLLFIG